MKKVFYSLILSIFALAAPSFSLASVSATISPSLSIYENDSATQIFSFVLSATPTSTVSIHCTFNPDQLTLSSTGGSTSPSDGLTPPTSTTTLTFSPATYNVSQTISVFAIDDTFVESSHTENITCLSVSTDSAFNTYSSVTTITIEDPLPAPLLLPPVIEIGKTLPSSVSNSGNRSSSGSRRSNPQTNPTSATIGETFSQSQNDNITTSSEIISFLESLNIAYAADQIPESLSPSSECDLLNKNLELGDKNESVLALQKFLREQGHFTYETNTGYFGPITRSAVIAFQNVHKDTILTPINLSAGTGFWYGKTRAHAMTLCLVE